LVKLQVSDLHQSSFGSIIFIFKNEHPSSLILKFGQFCRDYSRHQSSLQVWLAKNKLPSGIIPGGTKLLACGAFDAKNPFAEMTACLKKNDLGEEITGHTLAIS
jgi:hypothetical protein